MHVAQSFEERLVVSSRFEVSGRRFRGAEAGKLEAWSTHRLPPQPTRRAAVSPAHPPAAAAAAGVQAIGSHCLRHRSGHTQSRSCSQSLKDELEKRTAQLNAAKKEGVKMKGAIEKLEAHEEALTSILLREVSIAYIVRKPTIEAT